MKLIFLLIFPLLCNIFSYGQEACATQILHDYLMEHDAVFRTQYEAASSLTNRIADTGQVITIPVVVHVIHLGEQEGLGSNISTGQIIGAINKLNQFYRSGNGVNIGIEFCLAKVDPNGQPTNGITRTDGRVVPGYQSEGIGSSNSGSGLDIIDIKNLIQWPTEQYYNIHVVHEVVDASAFAYYPQNAPFFRDGTVIESFYMTNLFATLSHELGHAFNLKHTFDGDNSGNSCPANNNCETDGDLICDTSPHKRSDCFLGNSCVTGSDPTWVNTYQNHMSYCGVTNRFTPLQKVRMRVAAFASLSRTVLWENSVVCAPFPQLDGAIVSIDYPEDGIINEVCGLGIEAEFTFKNEGTTKITQFSVDYLFDDFASTASFTSNLNYGQSASFTLPSYLVNPNQNVNQLSISIANVNESADENGINDSESIAFGIYDTCTTTGLSELLANTIQIYPSPNITGFMQIKGIAENLQLSMEIIDVAGRILIRKENVQNNVEINIQSLSKGYYYLLFKNEKQLISKPFIRF